MRWAWVLLALPLTGNGVGAGREAHALRLTGESHRMRRLDDPAWQAAPLQTGFAMLGESRAIIPEATQTFFRVAYDAEHALLRYPLQRAGYGASAPLRYSRHLGGADVRQR